ncbi:hypothetical protein ASF58_18860 [Methylobacterium sp. Leaf125]|uniref:ceramidase domain-containing protein n=1 Tax=Methylobacterium sp. Leaf125 TaxID=1736265 RepID=UPI0007002603|nr:ceramidase domain-containing protein [Methylobacterium sp. Leaf125]KQQ45639.1 hypothetical protein ASF58_18860 [Methylobacterium sp. Leaf125]
MEGDWLAPICAYCERGDPGFWAEPVNALSNGAFLVAAALATARVRRARTGDAPALLLSALVAVVGVGSFLFHTLAVRWSLLADVIPIALFIYAYFLLAMRRYFDLGIGAALAATLAFAAFNLGLEPALDGLTGRSTDALTNGSLAYAPAILALAGVAAGLLTPRGPLGPARPDAGLGLLDTAKREAGLGLLTLAKREAGLGLLDPARREAGLGLLGVAALFAVSLGFRTLDRAVCPVWPLGTHAVWHLLNAGVLYGLIAVAVRYRRHRS